MGRLAEDHMRASALTVLCLVAACSESSLDQPLSTLAIRDNLVERPILVSKSGKNVSNLYLRSNSIAAMNGPSAEFGAWRFNDAGELCLLWRDQAEQCAPVYVTGGSHYRFGDSELSVLGP
jgi:hypothetical protein